MKLVMVFILIWGIGKVSLAQVEDERQIVREEGKMFTIELTPADKTLNFKVIGNEAAKIKSDGINLEVTYGIGREKRILRVSKQGDFYVVDMPTSQPKNLDVRVIPREGEPEQFQLSLDSVKP